MKKTTLLIAMLAAFMTAAMPAKARTYVPENPTSQEAVYNEAENTVTVSAIAPTKTEYDWNTYEQFDLPYISYVLVERHTPGTDWPEEEYGRVESPKPGEKFEFVDRNIEPDKQYEYKLTCYVDNEHGTSAFISVYTGITPGPVSAFTASTADHKTTTVDLSVTAPTLSASGSELEELSGIEIQLYSDWSYTTIHTIENVEPGKTYTWQHTGLQLNKPYRYRALARTGTEGVGEGIEANTYVGLDYPGTPENFTCTASGESVTIKWDAPAIGGRGGNYDPKSTTYTLRRVYLDDTEEIVADNITETEYTDNPGFNEETTVEYRLIAVNTSGESIKEATHAPVSVGNPTTLPFKESFAGQTLAHKGWMMESTQDDPDYTYDAWELSRVSSMFYFPTDEYLSIEPQDGDEGFAKCLFYGYCPDGQTESLISPRISTEGVDKVDFNFYFWEIQADASKNVIRASVSRNDGEWEELFVSEPPVESAPQWREVSLPITLEEECSNIRIRLDAIRRDGPITDMLIDNISVVKSSYSSVNNIATEDPASQAKTEYFTISGIRISKPSAPGTYIIRKGNTTSKIIIR